MRSLVKIPLSSLFLALVACGGGGATGSGTPAPPSAPDPSPPPSAVQTGIYMARDAVTTQDAALVALNDYGAQGHAWVSNLAIQAGTAVNQRALYVYNQTAPTRYSYVMEPGGLTDVQTWLAVANSHGQASRLFKGAMHYLDAGGTIRDIYVRRADKTAVFAWAAVALPASVDPVELLATMDSQGRNGYAWRGAMQFGASTQALFVRDSTRIGPFSYRLPAAPTTLAALSEQLAAQAAAGCRYLGPLQLGGAYSVYQCDATDPYPVTASARLTVTRNGESDMLATLNDGAAKGSFYLGDLVLGAAGATPVTVSVFSGGTQPAHPLSGPTWP